MKTVSPPTSAGANRERAPETVVLVHGLWMTGLELQRLAYGLREEGFRVRTFRYPSIRANLAQNAQRLAHFHEGLTYSSETAATATAMGRTHFVGHSLGGLVIARMLRDFPERLEHTGRVVALGTPFLGSASAKVFSTFPLLGSRMVGNCFPRDARHPRLPADLPCESWNFPSDLGIIAGTHAFGMGQMVGAFSSSNDGLIAVEETLLPGASAHLTLPINHVALTFSTRVIAQTCYFLRHGCFDGMRAGSALPA